MNRRRFLTTAAAAATVGIAGCGGEQRPIPDEEDIAVTVEVHATHVDPQIVEIEEGEAVRWVIADGRSQRAHIRDTVDVGTSWQYQFNDELPVGGSVAYLFEESGVYAYHDTAFSARRVCGAVVVGDATQDDVPQLPCAPA